MREVCLQKNIGEGLYFAELLMSKFIHDLANDAAVVSNCSDLIAHCDKSTVHDAGILLSENAYKLSSRLKFYGCAYGLLRYQDSMTLNEIATLVQSVFSFKARSICLECCSDPNVTLDPLECKILACLSVCAYMNVVKKGSINIRFSRVGFSRLVKVEACGGMQILDSQKLRILNGSQKDAIADIANCNEFYLRYLLSEMNHEIYTEQELDRVSYTVKFK
jgi:hypothetical protein